jgi:uncharacterized membrane protein
VGEEAAQPVAPDAPAEREGVAEKSRLETFSDGVMAIAITLLVLDVRVPHPGPGQSLAHALGHIWPSYAAYATSFLVIGIIWVNHHQMFKLFAGTNYPFLMYNVLFLMVLSFIPFPTALVSDALQAHEGLRTATLVYGGTMFAMAVMFNVVWLYAAKDRRLLLSDVSDEAIVRGTRSYRLGPTLYLVITLLAFLSPYLSLSLFAAFALYWLLPSSGPG